jgi:methenyltetrahydrofolate cyclohydrolase
MRSYTARSLGDVLDAFSSNQPVPGGGSAAALTGALGVSLLLMVADLPRTRTGSAQERAALDNAAARLRVLRVTLGHLIDRDSNAYTKVIDAFRLPKQSEDDQVARRRAIAEAMRGATETPLETMRACQQALADAPIVAANGMARAASDAGVAVELVSAALRGAALNVDVNLPEIRDASFVESVRIERERLLADGTADADKARAIVSPGPAEA